MAQHRWNRRGLENLDAPPDNLLYLEPDLVRRRRNARRKWDEEEAEEIIDRILHEIPPPPSRLAPGVPPAFDAVVARALEKSPTFRYQAARDMQQDLRDIARELDSGAQAATSRIASGFVPAAKAIKASVAVMTFANITREPADDWIGTGIAETVSSDLKNIKGLTVIGRARVFDALRNLSSSAHLDESLAIDIGRRLGATWVVVGGFQRLADVVRITANAVDVTTEAISPY